MITELIDKYVWLIQTFIDAGERGISLDEIMTRWKKPGLTQTGEKRCIK